MVVLAPHSPSNGQLHGGTFLPGYVDMRNGFLGIKNICALMLLSKASSVCCFQVNASLSLTSNCTGATRQEFWRQGFLSTTCWSTVRLYWKSCISTMTKHYLVVRSLTRFQPEGLHSCTGGTSGSLKLMKS